MADLLTGFDVRAPAAWRRRPRRFRPANALLLGAASVIDLGATLGLSSDALTHNRALSELTADISRNWSAIEEVVRDAVIAALHDPDLIARVRAALATRNGAIQSDGWISFDELIDEVTRQLLERLRSLLDAYNRSTAPSTRIDVAALVTVFVTGRRGTDPPRPS